MVLALSSSALFLLIPVVIFAGIKLFGFQKTQQAEDLLFDLSTKKKLIITVSCLASLLVLIVVSKEQQHRDERARIAENSKAGRYGEEQAGKRRGQERNEVKAYLSRLTSYLKSKIEFCKILSKEADSVDRLISIKGNSIRVSEELREIAGSPTDPGLQVKLEHVQALRFYSKLIRATIAEYNDVLAAFKAFGQGQMTLEAALEVDSRFNQAVEQVHRVERELVRRGILTRE